MTVAFAVLGAPVHRARPQTDRSVQDLAIPTRTHGADQSFEPVIEADVGLAVVDVAEQEKILVTGRQGDAGPTQEAVQFGLTRKVECREPGRGPSVGMVTVPRVVLSLWT